MRAGNQPQINWPVVLIFGPIALIGLLISALWPPALRWYIVAVGLAYLIVLVVYLVSHLRRQRRRRDEQP